MTLVDHSVEHGRATGTDVDPDSGGSAPTERLPWFVIAFCLLALLLPSVVVLPGPLKSNGSPSVMLAFAAFGLVLLGWVRGGRKIAAVFRNPGAMVLVVYLALELLVYSVGQTRLLSDDVEASTTRGILAIFANVGIALYVLTHVVTRRQRRAVLVALAVGLVFSAVVGLVEGVGGPSFRYLLEPPGFVLNRVRGVSVRDGYTRVLGTADHPIEFAVLMACAVPLVLHLARHGSSAWVRRGSALAIVVLLFAVPASVSRSALVALLCSLVVCSFSTRPRVLAGVAVLVGMGLVVYYWAAPGLLYTLYLLFAGASQDDSITGRTDDYATVGELFDRHPWLGQGLGTNPPSVSSYLDNQWLQALVQGGVVGFLALALVMAASFAGMFVILRCRPDRVLRDEGLALGAAAAAIFASNATFDLFSFQQATFVYFVVFGLIWSAAREARKLKIVSSDTQI